MLSLKQGMCFAHQYACMSRFLFGLSVICADAQSIVQDLYNVTTSNLVLESLVCEAVSQWLY